MPTRGGQFLAFLSTERDRYTRRLLPAALPAALIALLLYQTQWFNLRPGLTLLLLNQIGVVSALLYRHRKLTGTLHNVVDGLAEPPSPAHWFRSELRFLRLLSLFEQSCHFAGFALLGLAIWSDTRNPWLAATIGIIYPLAAGLGILRTRYRQSTKRLTREQQALT